MCNYYINPISRLHNSDWLSFLCPSDAYVYAPRSQLLVSMEKRKKPKVICITKLNYRRQIALSHRLTSAHNPDANPKVRSAEPIDQILIDKSSGWAVLLYFWVIYLSCALLSKFVWHFSDLIVAIWQAIIASLTTINGGEGRSWDVNP